MFNQLRITDEFAFRSSRSKDREYWQLHPHPTTLEAPYARHS
jgi:hypothetical protein